jgi:hypothetical protein
LGAQQADPLDPMIPGASELFLFFACSTYLVTLNSVKGCDDDDLKGREGPSECWPLRQIRPGRQQWTGYFDAVPGWVEYGTANVRTARPQASETVRVPTYLFGGIRYNEVEERWLVACCHSAEYLGHRGGTRGSRQAGACIVGPCQLQTQMAGDMQGHAE